MIVGCIEDGLLIPLKKEDKFKALEDIINSSSVFSSLDRKTFLEAVYQRERELSTYVGHGVLIAHGKVLGVTNPLIALGYSKEGVSGDRDPLHLIFVIASSPKQPETYLKAVSSILSWVHEKTFRDKLERADLDDEKVQKFFSMLKAQKFEVI